MKLHELKNLFHSELEKLYPKTEIDSFLTILTEHQLGLTRIDRALQPSFEIKENDCIYFSEAIQSLLKEIPVQYITGKTEFYSLPFHVNQNVLIPRPETEDLVHLILENSKNETKLNILDIGTGSGCIAISLAKNLPNAKIWALDFSKKAIETAKKNALLNKVEITFIQQDILKTNTLSQMFDIIVSNPPYVRELEKKEMQNNVLKHEPHTALFVEDNNPLLFYIKIAELAKKHLIKSGVLYFEINQYLGNETIQMLKEKGFTHNELKKDIFGNDRITKSIIR